MEAHTEAFSIIQTLEAESIFSKSWRTGIVCYQYAAGMGWPLDEAMDRIYGPICPSFRW